MKKKILVCEDDEVLSSMIQFKLSKETLGEVIKVTNGRDAKEVISENDIDLVISDIHMPFVSGMQLLEYTRKDLQKDTSFIMLSAEGLESTVMEAFDLGVTDFLTKPFSPGELAMRVKRLLA